MNSAALMRGDGLHAQMCVKLWSEGFGRTPLSMARMSRGDRGLAKCSYVSWNHRAAGKWINKYPLQPCCLFACSGRAGKARSPVAAWTLVRQTAADLRLSSLYGTLRPNLTWPAALHNSKHAQLFRLRKWDQTNKVGDFNLDALWHT